MAHEPVPQTHTQFRLPMLVFGVVEVRRLQRELEALEDYLRQANLREPGKQSPLPRVSRLLDALATDNNVQLLQTGHRQLLMQFLQYIEARAPTLHMSFAADPSSAFTSRIVSWLRANVHPYTLLQIGLQPTIAAGCTVRTANKIFDFSLRQQFAKAESLLVDMLDAASREQTPTPSASAAATPAPAAAVQTAAPARPATAPAETPVAVTPITGVPV